jgi:hypothetical protein
MLPMQPIIIVLCTHTWIFFHKYKGKNEFGLSSPIRTHEEYNCNCADCCSCCCFYYLRNIVVFVMIVVFLFVCLKCVFVSVLGRLDAVLL